MSMIEQDSMWSLKIWTGGSMTSALNLRFFIFNKKIYATIILLLLLCLVDVVSQKKYRLAKTRFRASFIYSK